MVGPNTGQTSAGNLIVLSPSSLEALRKIRDSDPALRRKWATEEWGNSVTADADGHLTSLDLGGSGRVRSLPPDAFALLPRLSTLNLGGTDLPPA
eukprot:CAMPEP_0183300224 /NCGR_PEP_ID=MMETSP0160_2-20130417/6729_1 /TAXON_ID=2839 ORGANISM="Odontella Sinensis, Strain Grunow 1884" /NCGR_SAMPLE_ID=MMETSP0160_2 /ASSEMBLY_ACC=CAM_ASM_000250 /LENGTH=94 /DNA_ID=CAMNT_0025462609 /DNA_START=17 /DNA_END=297 /DNA_ORIENTATION=-